MLFDLIRFVIIFLHIIGCRLSVSINDMLCYVMLCYVSATFLSVDVNRQYSGAELLSLYITCFAQRQA